MSLRLRLVLTLWLVTLLAGAITIGFAAAGAYDAADRATRNTLTRAGYVLERNYHMEPRAGDPLYAEMTSIKLAQHPQDAVLFDGQRKSTALFLRN